MQDADNPYVRGLKDSTGEDGEPEIPERRLLCAILTRAIMDATSFTMDVSLETRIGALEWLQEDDEDTRWTFGWICSELGWSASAVRQSVTATYNEKIIAEKRKKDCFLPQEGLKSKNGHDSGIEINRPFGANTKSEQPKKSQRRAGRPHYQLYLNFRVDEASDNRREQYDNSGTRESVSIVGIEGTERIATLLDGADIEVGRTDGGEKKSFDAE